MEEFEQMWQTVNDGEQQQLQDDAVDEDTPEYLIRDGMARTKILADLLINYFHAKYGEPLQEPSEEFEIKFHL